MAETNLKGDPPPADSEVAASNTVTQQPRWIRPVRTATSKRKADLLKQAVAVFDELDVPEIRVFLKTQKRLRKTGLRQDLLTRIANAVESGKIRPETLFGHLDQIKENGDQHIFLFKLRDEHISHLNRLKDQEYCREQLKNFGLEDRLTEPPLIWESSYPFPQLAKVSYEFTSQAPTALTFRWVETRFWRQQVRIGATRRIVPKRERSINCARIDLQEGHAEIRLQKLKPRARKSLNAELALYREQLDQLIDFHLFNPVLLESNVRGLLASKKMTIKDWRVRFREGGIGGDLLPNFLQKIGVKVLPAIGVYVVGDWISEEERTDARGKTKKKVMRFSARVDGRKDLVTIHDMTSANALNSFLDEIRSRGGLSIEIPELKKVADNRADLGPVLGKLDVRFREKKESAIDLEKFAMNEWAASDKVLQAAHILIEQYPERFTIKYSVVCPFNEKPARDSDGNVIAIDVTTPLQNFACLHDEEAADHPTAKQHTTRVKTELVATLPETVSLKTVWSELLRYVIVEKLFGRILERLLDNVPLASFAALYLVFLFIFSRKIFALIENVAFRQSLIAVTFIVGVVLITSLVIRLVGAKTFDRAWSSVREMLPKTKSEK